MNDLLPEERNADLRRSQPSEYWRKSSFSGTTGDCVEVAVLNNSYIGVRDSKATAAAYLRVRPDVWSTFIKDLQSARYVRRSLIL
jgi:hypothetical protein